MSKFKLSQVFLMIDSEKNIAKYQSKVVCESLYSVLFLKVSLYMKLCLKSA